MHNDSMEIRDVWGLDCETMELKENTEIIMCCVRSCFTV